MCTVILFIMYTCMYIRFISFHFDARKGLCLCCGVQSSLIKLQKTGPKCPDNQASTYVCGQKSLLWQLRGSNTPGG